jgi:hypothetical protein
MRTNLKKRKLLFKEKSQLANNNGQGGDERHNTKVDGRCIVKMPKLLI